MTICCRITIMMASSHKDKTEEEFENFKLKWHQATHAELLLNLFAVTKERDKFQRSSMRSSIRVDELEKVQEEFSLNNLRNKEELKMAGREAQELRDSVDFYKTVSSFHKFKLFCFSKNPHFIFLGFLLFCSTWHHLP